MSSGTLFDTLRTALLSASAAFVVAAVLAGPAGSAQGTVTAPLQATASQAALVKTYCATCHSDRTRSGELSLEHADLSDIPKNAELWEKVIRKVRAGMMPPAGMPRPDAATLNAFVTHLETTIDRAAAANPRPGRTALRYFDQLEWDP